MSSKIAVLPAEVATRIAAGEVIERPASAVKELVENAIDAGARRITIDVAEAGRRLIRVTDDGEGMTPDDARQAFLRHATSKIRTDSDLSRIQTLGFRGEALPSIAAVSRMRVVTMPAGASCGTEIRLDGGSIKDDREAATASGTVVEVADLFFNTPARKKFLKSPATELGHICQVIQRQALGFPCIHFRLGHNGANVLEYPGVRSLRERIQQVYGLTYVDASLEITADDEDLRIEGLCSRPLDSGVGRSPQEMLVNRRWVKCPALAHAVYEGYGTYLAKGNHPRFVLHLSIEPQAVDMNVHPAKREVRFSNQEQLHDQVRTWIRRAIGTQGTGTTSGGLSRRGGQGSTQETPVKPPMFQFDQSRESTFDPRAMSAGSQHAAEAARPYATSADWEVRPLGQIAERYVLAQVGEELQIVDQHTAHERVLFERLCRQLEQGPIVSQQSLLPHTVELSASAAVVLTNQLAALAQLGFDVETFGERTFLLRGVPALLTEAGHCDPEALLRAMVEDWETDVAPASLKERHHPALATMACHSAVRSGRRMESAEIRQLLENWREAGLPSTCPHGRRVAMRLTIEELDRIFGRQGWA